MNDRTLRVCVGLLWLSLVVPVGVAQTPAEKGEVGRVKSEEPDALAPQAVYPRQPATGYAADCTVIRVIDGDTLEVAVTQKMHVRLLQCWAPESRTRDKAEKALGLAAREHLQELVSASPDGAARVFVPVGIDLGKSLTLNRCLGYVWMRGDEISVNQRQVDEGFAVESR